MLIFTNHDPAAINFPFLLISTLVTGAENLSNFLSSLQFGYSKDCMEFP